MKYVESDLKIINDISPQTLHSQIFGDLGNAELIELLETLGAFEPEAVTENELEQIEILAAIKSETICGFDQSTIEGFINQRNPIVVDCSGDNLAGESVITTIKRSITNHPVEKTFIIVSPITLTMLQSHPTSDFKANEGPEFNTLSSCLAGTFDDVSVYCGKFMGTGTAIVSNYGIVEIFEFENLSFI